MIPADIKQKTLIVLMSFLVVLAGLLFLGIFPLVANIKNHSAELLAVRKELALLEQKSALVSQTKQELEAQAAELEEIQDLFVNPDIPIGFLQFLEKEGKSAGLAVDISLLSSEKKKGETRPLWLGFEVQLIGPLPGCLKFLERVEAAPYLIDIERLGANRATEKQLESKTFQGLLKGDARMNLSIKVATQ